MTAPARLLALRLQGFKSFAERTVVEFGPGISAVVGPNGSGKSNLADALRWALGEQGRSLRTRRSEDVIWAGSERRSALGMADVTLVLDNADGLLPVDYSVLELGRRLFRSGENDYLLNKQRVRLRDLVDLLDAANLADNAFLFIGQGMVDQALALRPEERRPLFEEVAGVRRHERRRRKAEDQLAESETNLARVEDILSELRPQARRLAAQAEQQATRATAGQELAAALVAAARDRWHGAAARLAEAASRRARAARDADGAMAALQAAEAAAAVLATELDARVALERGRREAHETARTALTVLQLREARLAGDLDAIQRDAARLVEERSAAEAAVADQRRALAAAGLPARDVELEAALTEAERHLAEALAELGALRAADRARGEELAAVRRAEAAREAELETARRRLAEAERRAAEERERFEAAAAVRQRADVDRAAASASVSQAVAAERAAAEAAEAARVALEAREATRRRTGDELAAATSGLAAVRARAWALDARLGEEETRGIGRVARRHGGRRVDEELVVEAGLRPAVEAALAETVRAYLVERDSVAALAGERGVVIVAEATRAQAPDGSPLERRLLERVAELGGSRLTGAVRRDPGGAASAVLARTVALPDLAACLALQPELPLGWQAVAADGSAVVTSLAVAFGRPDGPLERRAELAQLLTDIERLEASHRTLSEEDERAAREAGTARTLLATARDREATAGAVRRRAEEAERLAIRSLEAAVREAGWHEAQAARLGGEADRAQAGVAALATGEAADPATGQAAAPPATSAIAAWEARVTELRARRDRLASEHGVLEAARREAEARRARAEASAAMGEEQIARADRDATALNERRSRLEMERDGLRAELTTAVAMEQRTRASLDEVRTADAAGRSRLGDAERETAAARERLRGADERLRAADHGELEARLGLDGLREQTLVDLAGLGEPGLAALRGGPSAGTDATERDGEDAAAFEAALDAVAPAWAASPPPGDAPLTARLAQLRRRYHELGASNPYAGEEYAELRVRLESLETQDADLRSAIAGTRELIEQLNRMIAEQFGSTFRALEAAFDRRFSQLFGGGYARLSLTDPDDLSATGIEIVARPPGKKAQALAMLSGGERALTAVALLFAMLEVRPVPFCVLDEVDAALDEANVGRFSEALRSLADATQFIVITHNRGTIEAADALYGVTVGDDSVSRVISLRLDEARAIAGRGRAAEPARVAAR